jgi:hypothetical protein
LRSAGNLLFGLISGDSISSIDWSKITGTPSTLSGYGITDAYTKAESDNKFVPYTGANANVNLGSNNITANSFIKSGGTSAQFLKADGSVDTSQYVPTTRSVNAGTGLSGGGNLSSDVTIAFDTTWGDNRYAYRTRQLTINGTTFDLSADRTWNVGTTTGTGASGQVAFWNGTSSQTGDNKLTWNNTEGGLTINSQSSTSSLRGLNVNQANDGVQAAAIIFTKSRGTIASPTNVNANDLVGAFSFSARVGGAFTADRALFGANMASTTGMGLYFIAGDTNSNYSPAIYVHPTKNVSIAPSGSILTGITDSGFRLDVNGTARVQGVATITGSTTASSAIARGANLTSTLVAAANNDVLVGLDVNPTFTNGAFTGVQNIGVRVNSSVNIINTGVYQNITSGTLYLKNNSTGGNNYTFIGIEQADTLARAYFTLGGASAANADLRNTFGVGTQTNNPVRFLTSDTTRLSILGNGNVLINTTTDAGFRLDVQGSTRFNGLSTIQGTTASDSGQLGAELLTTGTGDASWTGTSFATGYTHVVGSTTTLTSTLAGVVNTFYQITYTVTGRTTGNFAIDFGGQSISALTATGAFGPKATTTGTLVITPTSDFNGTIVLSIRVISISSASVTFNNSAGTITNQIRISSLTTNTFVGLNAGRTNTTGINNSFVGSNAGIENTTGRDNSFFGQASGLRNTTGRDNSFFGARSGEANTTGVQNSFFGQLAGFTNTTGNSNSFFGQGSGFANTTGGANSFFGTSSGAANTTGGSNAFFGQASGANNTTGNSNSFFGASAGQLTTTGGNNVSIGTNALVFNTTGSSNVAVGQSAGRNIADGNNLTIINSSVFIGNGTRAAADNQTNQIVIGTSAIGLGSNTTVLGNTSTTFGRWYGSLLLGTTTNVASSILTMESTTQGFLPPRMTSAQRTAIASPAEGLLVIQTDGVQGLYIYINATWRAVTMV